MRNLSYFLGKIFFGDDRLENEFVYQPTFSMFEFNKNKGTEYGIAQPTNIGPQDVPSRSYLTILGTSRSDVLETSCNDVQGAFPKGLSNSKHVLGTIWGHHSWISQNFSLLLFWNLFN